MRTSMILAPGNRDRMAATAGSLLASRTARLALADSSLGERLAALFARQRDHPVPAGPGLQPRRQVAEQGLWRIAGQADVEPAGLDADQPHIVLQRTS